MNRYCLLAGLLLGLWAPAAAARPPAIEIRGNRVFNQATYQALLDMPPPLPEGDRRAAAARRRLLRFLRRAGYVLATVRVASATEPLVLEVDEGRLDRVLFLGTGTLRALQLKLELAIPHRVFNRPELERQIEELRRRHHLARVRWELVPSRKVRHQGPQVEALGAIEGQPIIPPPGKYELRIHLDQGGVQTGMSLDANYDFPDGLELGVGYLGAGLLFDADRWYSAGLVGGQLRDRIDDGSTYPALSRAAAEAWWATPPLIGRGFRPALRLASDLRSRQRRDLDVEIYYRESLEAGLWLGWELWSGSSVALGGGVDQRWLFGVELADPQAPPLDERERLRAFLDARLELVFDPREPRRDRRHRLSLGLRHAWLLEDDTLGRAEARYRLTLGFGWHDLVIGLGGAWLWGEVGFDDQEPVGGRHLRGVFGDRYWVERVCDLRLEFRFSLARDLYKLSLFHDLAVFGQLDQLTGDETARVADSFGLGFHALILDLFQLDLYYGVGFSSEAGAFDHGASASLTKVF